jgi:hypothetical protein
MTQNTLKNTQQELVLLRQYLECYGSDTAAWPDAARAWVDARKDISFTATVAQEKQFEALLRSRSFTPARADLAQRIAQAARMRTPQPARPRLLPQFLVPGYLAAYFRPSVLASVLALGFALGFNTFHQNSNQGTASLQSYTDDEGAVL